MDSDKIKTLLHDVIEKRNLVERFYQENSEYYKESEARETESFLNRSKGIIQDAIQVLQAHGESEDFGFPFLFTLAAAAAIGTFVYASETWGPHVIKWLEVAKKEAEAEIKRAESMVKHGRIPEARAKDWKGQLVTKGTKGLTKAAIWLGGLYLAYKLIGG